MRAISERVRAVTKSWVRRVMDDEIPWNDYVASTKLTKDTRDYATDNVATVLVKRLQATDPSRVVAVGDRVSDDDWAEADGC